MANTLISQIPSVTHYADPGLSLPSRQVDYLKVPFGQLTFDMEGSELEGPHFSRRIHWPGGASGVTVGRGYDMGKRTRLQVIHELTHAGVSVEDAALFSLGAGLRGQAAHRFVRTRQTTYPLISLSAQRNLFSQVAVPEVVNDLKRLFNSPTVVERYGKMEWHDLCPEIQELLFDLRYRGDYTPKTREFLQPLIALNDRDAISSVMSDSRLWIRFGVPSGRIVGRSALLAENKPGRMCA